MGKNKKKQLPSLLSHFDADDVAEAAEFLECIEDRCRAIEQSLAEEAAQRADYPTPVGKRLIERIEKAFADVTSYRDVRGLLGGEAEDDYMSPTAQALLAPHEERDDWRRIPESMLVACNSALSYLAAGAYRFYLPAFLCAELRGAGLLLFPGVEPGGRGCADLERGRCVEFTFEQQACLSDYLNYESLSDYLNYEIPSDGERERYWPWELDDYAANHAADMTLQEYGRMLVQRYRDSEGL